RGPARGCPAARNPERLAVRCGSIRRAVLDRELRAGRSAARPAAVAHRVRARDGAPPLDDDLDARARARDDTVLLDHVAYVGGTRGGAAGDRPACGAVLPGV